MLVVLVVGFRLIAFITLLIKSSQFNKLSCIKTNKERNESKNNGKLVIETSTIVEMKNNPIECEEYSRL